MTMVKRLVYGVSAILMSSMFPAAGLAAEATSSAPGADWMGLAYIGAGLAVGLACIASGFAVARIGSSAIGAVTEKPELMGRTLVFLGLAEGIAIYGLIIAIMILNKL
ncbi:MAG: ATP synthase subunit C [Acidobacteriota bacterium]|nr:ATP synthase subunit C [Acidobacteriota bacterium]